MRNPTHPGEIIHDALRDSDLTALALARALGVSKATLYRVFNGEQPVSPSLAVALERAGWSNAEFWMRLQVRHDLAKARRALEAA